MAKREALETARLILEPMSPAHAHATHEAVLASRPELLPWMPWAREPTLEGGRAAAARTERAWEEDRAFHFAVLELRTRAVVGVVGLNRADDGVAELHYWIRSDHTGQGLATETCQALIGWAPRALGVRKLILWAGRDNHASRRVATKLGFVHVGPLDWRPEGGLGHFDAEAYELVITSQVARTGSPNP